MRNKKEFQVITSSSDVMSGATVFAGTRVPAKNDLRPLMAAVNAAMKTIKPGVIVYVNDTDSSAK